MPASMPDSTTAPLTDDELAELDEFLLIEDGENEKLSIDEAHGFLTALIVSAEGLDETQWLAYVWGAPSFPDKASEEHLTGLMRRLYGDIQAMLASNEKFDPLVIEEETDEGDVIEIHEGWCFGFMLALETNLPLWDDMSTQEQSLLAPIAKLALLHDDEEDEEVAMDDEEQSSLIDLIPGSVAGLYHWFQSKNA